MRRALGLLLLGVVALAAFVVVQALRLPSRQVDVPPAPLLEVDAAAAAARLAEALRFETISYQDEAQLPHAAFEAFDAWLVATYPKLHARLEREPVSRHGLLYTWRGAEPDLAPIVLLAHHDVVPIASPERWTHPPFGGVIADGYVWGRGAMDDKGSVVAICEAVERLLGDGFTPRRTVHLAFGHDEEVGGPRGAVMIAQQLAARGVRAHLVLDEGMAVIDGAVPGVERPAALIGVAEKGYATIELSVSGLGGHSSIPPRNTAAGILASAVHRLEAQPLPGGVDGVTEQLFLHLAPEMSFAYRLPFANLWLFRGLVGRILGEDPAMNALIRTTTAVTMLEGSPKENVLPQRATAAVNFRIRPGDTSEYVLQHVRRAVDDPRVELRFLRPPREPSPVSPTEGEAFELLTRTIGELFPDAIVAPALVLGGTDARHYTPVSDAVYRFGPFVYTNDDLGRAHGVDERMGVESLATGIRFYERLIRNAQDS